MEPTPPMALLTVKSGDTPPSLETAARQLGVRTEDIDSHFGIVLVDPREGLYCVQVRADRVPADLEQRQPHRGPFANPAIAPLGPVEDSPDPKKA